MIKEIRLQNVDMGIAMCHFELVRAGARAGGLVERSRSRDTVRRAGVHRQLDGR